MSDDLVKRLRATTDGATVNPDGPEAADRIAALEAALRVYECNSKCANCYGAVRNTKYCGQIARAALAGGKKDE
jgi:hypothetical protein